MEMYSFISDQTGDRAMRKPSVFLDRDGVMIRNMNYLRDPGQIYFLPGVFEGLKRMRSLGFRLIMISNQSGLGRGYFTEEDLLAVHRRMTDLLAEEKIFLDACYYCPHRPDEGCRCRKPATGMLEQACAEFAVDRGRSWMIGDSECDMKLACNFAVGGILIHEKEPVPQFGQVTACGDLCEAADWIERSRSVPIR